ncbi:MAG: HAMP domain-containing sensor histidine kinase [Acidimicrobiales bacterium]
MMRLDADGAVSGPDGLLERVTEVSARLIPGRNLRPLQGIRSLKLKLSIVILAAVGVTVAAGAVGFWLNVRPRYSVAVAVVLALVMVQVLARGITVPIRELAAATDQMAAGDYSRRVTSGGADEIGRLADSFNVMAGQIAELERQHRDLIAAVSHELRTPLAVLQGNLENLIDGVVVDDAATLEAMARQTSRLSRLVTQLLDLSRLDAGVAPFHPAPIDLAQVVARVVEEIGIAGEPTGLVVDMSDTVPMTADPERLHQVVANLLDNARRHAPEGSVVRLGVVTGDGRVTLSVIDDGPGIPVDQLDSVFEPFHRVGHGSGGTGLGLAISRWVAQLHGGSLRVTNTEPGCRFDLDLPLTPTTNPGRRAPALLP